MDALHIAETNPIRAAEIGAETGAASVTDDWRVFLDDASIDAIIIASTPESQRFPIVRAVLDGASLGRAALTAQQKFISSGGHMGPHDLKTIAQFLLLGDPSIHPVKAGSKPKSKSKTKAREKGACPRHGAA